MRRLQCIKTMVMTHDSPSRAEYIAFKAGKVYPFVEVGFHTADNPNDERWEEIEDEKGHVHIVTDELLSSFQELPVGDLIFTGDSRSGGLFSGNQYSKEDLDRWMAKDPYTDHEAEEYTLLTERGGFAKGFLWAVVIVSTLIAIIYLILNWRA